MKRLQLTMLCLLAGIMCAKAQIGYQISLLNTATGEPRANETVTVTVNLSNNAGEVFYSETKQSTTNDFGVLSLTIGNADTFKDVDLTKMPFFIEATANGVMIGKSQILSVPVAEVAKQIKPMDKSEYVGTWYNIYDRRYYYTINPDGTIMFTHPLKDQYGNFKGNQVCYGNYWADKNYLIVKWNDSTNHFFYTDLTSQYIIPIMDSTLLGAKVTRPLGEAINSHEEEYKR